MSQPTSFSSEKYEPVLTPLNTHFEKAILHIEESFDCLSITVQANEILKILTFLHDTPTLDFALLTDITGVHYPDSKGAELCAVYHLHNLPFNRRLRLKAFVPKENPTLPSAAHLYAGANWMERETYDFLGILFEGHPNLQRILNVDEMDYFPLRKEYPLEDQTRQDKDDEMFGRGGSF